MPNQNVNAQGQDQKNNSQNPAQAPQEKKSSQDTGSKDVDATRSADIADKSSKSENDAPQTPANKSK